METASKCRKGLVGVYEFVDNHLVLPEVRITLDEAEVSGVYKQCPKRAEIVSRLKERAVAEGSLADTVGSVVYDTRTGSYTVYCPAGLSNDRLFREGIKDNFNLNSEMVDFEAVG